MPTHPRPSTSEANPEYLVVTDLAGATVGYHLRACSWCGAVVTVRDTDTHTSWHDEISARIDFLNDRSRSLGRAQLETAETISGIFELLAKVPKMLAAVADLIPPPDAECRSLPDGSCVAPTCRLHSPVPYRNTDHPSHPSFKPKLYQIPPTPEVPARR